MGLACLVLHGYIWPVYLHQESKTDGEEHCFKKQFGFIPHYLGQVHLFWVAEKATKIDENIPLVSLKAT